MECERANSDYSVIFASAYRFTVLFSYTATDSSYTLAPTVGWTAIEMSAGIVSACLPTMKPALTFFGRHLGFSGFVSRNFHTMNRSNAVQSAVPSNMRSGTGHRDGGSDADLVSPPKKGDFYRLDDEVGMQTFSPDNKKHGHVQTTAAGNRDSLSGDEAPLKGIRIQRDFEQSVN